MTSVQARTGERRRAATQRDLLDATQRLLEGGASIAGLSIDRIVREAGVVRTTFYLHFRDKLALVRALTEDQVAWLETAGRTGQDVRADPDLSRPTVERAVREIVTSWAAHRAVLAAIIETAEHDAEIRALWTDGIGHVARVASDLFAAHWDLHPAARPQRPQAVAEVLTWMIERSCHQIAREDARVDDVVDALSEVIWRVLN